MSISKILLDHIMCKLWQIWEALHHLTTSPLLPPATHSMDPRRGSYPCLSLQDRSQPVPHLCGPIYPPRHRWGFPSRCTSSRRPGPVCFSLNPLSKRPHHGILPAVHCIPELPVAGKAGRAQADSLAFPPMVPGAKRNAQGNASTLEDRGDLQQMTYLLHIQLSP